MSSVRKARTHKADGGRTLCGVPAEDVLVAQPGQPITCQTCAMVAQRLERFVRERAEARH